jgi:hypothetical protein
MMEQLNHEQGRCFIRFALRSFLQHRRLAAARREKRISGPPPQPTLPTVRHAILELIAQLPPQRCPHCRKWICNEPRRE